MNLVHPSLTPADDIHLPQIAVQDYFQNLTTVVSRPVWNNGRPTSCRAGVDQTILHVPSMQGYVERTSYLPSSAIAVHGCSRDRTCTCSYSSCWRATVTLFGALTTCCRWPEPPRRVDTAPVFAGFSLDGQVTDSPFMKLPNELLVPLLSELPLLSILSISSTCRHLRNLITAPTFLDVVLKEAIAAGSLRWLLPLASLDDEPVRAYNAVRLWLPEEYRPRYISPPPPMDIDWDKGEYKSDDEDSEDEDLPVRQVPALPVSPSAMLLSPHLDRLAFLRACWESDSMMNRKRLWGQVKQFERIWADYRLHGWHVDRFYSSDDLKPTDNIIRE